MLSMKSNLRDVSTKSKVCKAEFEQSKCKIEIFETAGNI